ncbi:MAG: SDR family oxidoreductase [Bacillota bacterium]
MKDIFSVEGKKGFVTGAAQGIGECLAKGLAERGADVAIIDINIDLATKTAEKIAAATGRLVKAYQCDITSEESVAKMMEAYLVDYGTIDYCINNAGIAMFDSAIETSAADFKKVVDIDLNGTFITAKAAAKVMIEQGKKGSIVSTASMSASLINVPQTIASYCAAKAGVAHLTKALAVEWIKYGIRVNCVSPGYILTDLVAELKDMHPIWLSKLPEGSRLGTPEDLIGSYLYFISDASAYATGTDLIIDGGYTSL